ncbi:PfkB family carbohydrate kinase [Aquihabitans sp. McL0605]|uniref:PfkB family carbohydrate kinase n=1 Tax=Aquihabitans sp. McL0605 TaxID=3415671 RepID=UPI003CF6E181
MTSYVAIGSVCWDVVAGDAERRLGGSVLFASRLALAQGWDAHIVTSGTEELERALRESMPDVKVTVQRSAVDTVFEFSADADLGPQRLASAADPIDVSLVDLGIGADVVHLAPIMGEVTPAMVASVQGAPFVGITPQGMLRATDATGALLRRPDLDAWWAAHVHAAVLSEDEYALVAEPSTLDRLALAITRGERGCLGRQGALEVDVAGIVLDHVSPVGTIGAGDVFAAAFFLALAGGAPFDEALRRANRTAADHVGGIT